MRKRNIIYLLCILTLSFALCLLSGCKNNSGEENIKLPDFTFSPISYPDYRFEERYLESDEFIVLDGKLDEDFWKEQNYLSRGYGDVTCSITTKYGEKGVYFGIFIDDKHVHVNPLEADWRNTGIELHIASADAKDREDAVMLRINPANVTMESMRGTYSELNNINGYCWDWVPFYVKSFINAEYEENFISVTDSEGLSFELLLPWSAIGMTGPGEVICLPAYNHTESYEVDEHLNYFHLQYEGSMFEISTWPSFDENGCTIPSDSETDIIGDALKGAYKSAGWDLTNRENGVIRALGGYQQIWFRNEASTSYTVETTISNAKAYNDVWPSGGIILADDLTGQGVLIQLFIGYNGEGATEWIKIYNLQREEPCIRYIELGGNTGAKTAAGCKLKATRNGKDYCIYINDQLIYKDSSDYLTNASIAGLYTVGMTADYSDFSYTSDAVIPNTEPAVGEKGILDIQSLGWDLSKLDSNKVTSSGGMQEIRFNQSISNTCAVETTISNAKASNDVWPSGGIVLADSTFGTGLRVSLFTGYNGNGATEWIKVYDLGRTEPCIRYIDLQMNTGAKTAAGCKLKVLRDGMDYYIFVNDRLIYKDSSELLKNASIAGFYSSGMKADFSNYSYSDNPVIPTEEPATGIKGIIDVYGLGWDLSKLNSNQVTAKGGLQEIYFNKSASTSYTMEVTVSNVKALNDGWPSIGMIVGKDSSDKGIRLQFFTGWEGKGSYHFFKVYNNQMSEPTIELVNLSSTSGVETEEGARLKVVRDGKKFTFYINDEQVYSGESELLGNAGCPGFYANGCTATFSDYSYVEN